MSHLRNNEKKHLKSLEETERNKITNQIFSLHTADGVSGFVRVMENLESHGISKKKFQAWKVMEFRSESWKVMENCYNLTFCKNRDENKENSLLSQVFV